MVKKEKREEKKKKNALMIKLDFRKTYDLVRWNFLDHVLEIMGFSVKYRLWISQCVSTTSISILINGFPFRVFVVLSGPKFWGVLPSFFLQLKAPISILLAQFSIKCFIKI